jgi:cytosine/adenosine deaminase-related metal-dependent hydrolase
MQPAHHHGSPGNWLIQGARIVTMNGQRQEYAAGSILVRRGRIVWVGRADEAPTHNDVETIDGTGMLAMPGFVNVHTHVNQILLRGGPSHGRRQHDWLINVLFPGLACYSLDDARTAARLFTVEAIRAGITTLVDNDNVCAAPEVADDFRAVNLGWYRESGLRVIYGRMIVADQRNEAAGRHFSQLKRERGGRAKHVDVFENGPEALASVEALMRSVASEGQPLLRVWPSPSTPVAVSAETLRGCRDLAARYDAGWTTHLQETPLDEAFLGTSPTRYLAEEGLLSPRLVLAHAVDCSDDDLDLIAEHRAHLNTNPAANAYLGSGLAPVPKMLRRHINVALGTDDTNDNDSINPLSDLKLLVHLHQAANAQPDILPPETALEMATINGAEALGLENETGSLEPGKAADIILIDLRHPQLTPMPSAAAGLVFQAYGNEVDTVMVAGRLRMRGRKLIDWDEGEEVALREEAHARAGEILTRAGLATGQVWPLLR